MVMLFYDVELRCLFCLLGEVMGAGERDGLGVDTEKFFFLLEIW